MGQGAIWERWAGETTHLGLSFRLFLFMSKAVPGDDSSSFVAAFSNRCCFRQPSPAAHWHTPLLLLLFQWLYCDTASYLARSVAFWLLSFLNLEISHLISANCLTPIWNDRMYFCVYANVSISACFPLQSCDVSEDLVCLQLSALCFNFLWWTHSPSLCKTARTRAVPWQFFSRAGYFCPVCGWVLCGCQADRGCRRRVRIKEDVATSSKPHETVLSFLLIFHLNLEKKKKKRKGSSDIRSVDYQFSCCPTAWICVHMLMWPAGFFRLRLFWCVRMWAGSSLNSVCVVFAKAWVWREHLCTWQLDLTEMNGKADL